MKKKIIPILVVLLIIILLAGTYLVCDKVRVDNIIKTKKNNYSEVIKTTKKIKLYKKTKDEYIEIGEIGENSKLYLEKTNYKNDYYKLLDEEYYIYYENIKQVNEKIKNIDYLPFNSNIVTTDKFELDNIKINEQKEFNIYLKKDGNYIKFNNQLFKIDQKYVKEEKEVKNGEYADSIVILNLINYDEEQLKYISSYKMINNETYRMWKNNEIELSDNTILLVSDKDDELFKKYNLIVNKIEFEINKNDEVSTKENLNSYEVDNITIDTLKKMLNKEKIVKYVYSSEVAVPVLNYHFFYDKNGEVCNETICLDTAKFEEHLKYLKDNNFKTLTMQEFVDWYNGKIEIPTKSVLITVDDGAMGTSTINGNKLIPLLEKYDLNATLFLITAWWDPKNYQSKNLDIESHGYDIHKVGACGSQNINCLSYNELYDDLKKSFDIVGSYNSFCYPFYVHNANSTEVLKNLGVQVAFGGGNVNATRNSNRYYIPRYPIYSSITMEQFINMVN